MTRFDEGDRANGKERMLETISLGDPDRRPVCPPYQGYWALRLAEIGVVESIEHPERAARAQVAAARECGFDGYEMAWDLFAPVQALGCEIKFLDSGTVSTVSTIIDSPEDVERICLPDLRRDARLQSSLESARRIMEMDGTNSFLHATMSAPFTLVGELRGLENLLLDSLSEEDLVIRMLEAATDCVLGYSQEYLDLNPDMISFTDPTASGALISLENFRKYSLPYVKRCSDEVRSQGAKSMVRVYGDDRLEDTNSIGADVCSMDTSVGVRDACRIVRSALLGNVDPIRFIFSGRDSDVRGEVTRILSSARERGFILGAGGDIPPGSPLANVKALLR